MIQIPVSKAIKLISPRLIVLINTIDEKGELNSSPYSWVFPLSLNPKMIGVGLANKKRLSYINAKRTKELVVCVVSEDFGQKAINCAKKHEPGDKLWEKQGLHTEESIKVNVPRIKESRAVFECKVHRFLEYGGDHIVLVGKIVHAEAQEGGLDKINPLFHDTGNKFRKLGKEIIFERKKI